MRSSRTLAGCSGRWVCLRAGKFHPQLLEAELEGLLQDLVRTPGFIEVERNSREVKGLARAHTGRWAQACPGSRPLPLSGAGGRVAAEETGSTGSVNWGSRSRCCDAIGLSPPTPHSLFPAAEKSALGGGRGRGGVKGGGKWSGWGQAGSCGLPGEDAGWSAPAADVEPAQFIRGGLPPSRGPVLLLGWGLIAELWKLPGQSPGSKVRSPRIVLPEPSAWGRGRCC